MAVFDLLADLALIFGKEVYMKSIHSIFITYLQNTAASVRDKGVLKAANLAQQFGSDWVVNEFIPVIVQHYGMEKKGYNYRMCCLNSFSAVMPFTPKDAISSQMVPIFLKAAKDEIPNVKFCLSKLIISNK